MRKGGIRVEMNERQMHSFRAKRKKQVLHLLQALGAILVTLVFSFPLYWMLITSLKSGPELIAPVPTIWPANGMQFENYYTAMTRLPLLRYMLNTVVVTFGQMLLQLVTGVLAAYGFSRGTFRGRNALFVIVLGALMIPHQVTFVPLYTLISSLNLIDTFAGLILPSAVSAYLIFMLRQNFMAIDQSYLDAGKVDGLGIFGTIWYVLLPMSRASVITVVLISLIDGWNNYFWPKIISKGDATRVLAVGLVQLRDSWDQSQAYQHYNCVMAGVAVSLIPIVVLFFLNQKHVLSGYSKAAMK